VLRPSPRRVRVGRPARAEGGGRERQARPQARARIGAAARRALPTQARLRSAGRGLVPRAFGRLAGRTLDELDPTPPRLLRLLVRRAPPRRAPARRTRLGLSPLGTFKSESLVRALDRARLTVFL